MARKLNAAPADSVICYLRCSTESQANVGVSLDAQRAAVATEAQRRGWTVVAEFVDAGVSGGKGLDQRPGLAAAVEAVENGQAGALVAAKLDRISRSTLDTALLLERSARNGWKLTTCDLAIDTSSPTGEATASVMAAFSQLERRLIGQRTREALAVKKAQGIRLGRPSTLSADVIARIISNRADGMSYNQIAALLTADAVPTAQGGARWYAATVRKVLAGQEAAKLSA